MHNKRLLKDRSSNANPLIEEDYQLYKHYDVSGRAVIKGVLLSGKSDKI